MPYARRLPSCGPLSAKGGQYVATRKCLLPLLRNAPIVVVAIGATDGLAEGLDGRRIKYSGCADPTESIKVEDFCEVQRVILAMPDYAV